MDIANFFSLEVGGQGWKQIGELGLAFFLSSLIGLEREVMLKSAGLRTHTLVGMGAALLMLISKYGFTDVVKWDNVGLDPSRVAGQIVTGIGFIGAGLIFVRKDIVHGLTTAATIWLTAAIAMACTGGLPILAIIGTVGHFVAMFVYSKILRHVLGISNRLSIRYRMASGTGAASSILELCSIYGFTMRSFSMSQESDEPAIACMVIRVRGPKLVAPLMNKLLELPAVISVKTNSPSLEE